MGGGLNALLRVAVMTATSGGSQNFLGAGWVPASLKIAPRSWKRPMALRFLAASPHYFYRNKTNERLATGDFLESEYRRNLESRRLIIDGLIAGYAQPEFVCLDYGCGPGFLALSIAPRVRKVIACDISAGVLACAAQVNPALNIEYRIVAPNGKIPAPDESVDLVYSFAVIQHVTDDVLGAILREFRRVMKPGAKAVCHVVLDNTGAWKPESEWRADRSLKGRIKWEVGLHCFSRSREALQEMIAQADLKLLQIVSIADLGVKLAGDDVERQHLCVFAR